MVIYLASPYSDPDPTVRQARFEDAVAAAARFWKAGFVVFSPIAHSHPIALHGLEGTWEQWQEFDKAILGACSELWVLQLDGWDVSRGVAAEIAFAKEWGLPIRWEPA